MRIGLDGDSLQVRQHQRDEARLSLLLSEWEAELSASPQVLDSLTDRALRDLDVLLVATRVSPASDAERRCLRSFVERGGGLLLLTNHADWPGHNEYDHTRHDRSIAELFGLSIERAWFRTPGGVTRVSTSDFDRNHPILTAKGVDGRSVESVVFNNCSALTCTSARGIIRLPLSVVDERCGLSPEGLAFAVAMACGDGRVVATADSGFIGSPSSLAPGPGLLDRGSNLLFVTNALLWAAERL